MTAILDPRAADRLAKLCGMFGSDHDGERAGAAAKADELVRSHGLTWPGVIAPLFLSCVTSHNSRSTEEQIGFALANLDALSMWERGFLYTVNGRPELSPKQRDVLNRIDRKVRAYRDGGGA